ncbi:MAG: hypothetical protein IJW79_01105 [Clostridia bacterium]|nr:hypothetical protein [Clostridia bacterium]
MGKIKAKKIISIVSNILLYLFLAICIFSVFVTVFSKRDSDGAAEVFGYQMRVVTTDSMAKCELTDVSDFRIKSLPVGTLLFIKTMPEDEAKADEWYSKVEEGDVLTFKYVYDRQVVITHRVTDVDQKDGGGYIIKLEGDNKNSNSDQLTQVIDTSIKGSTNYVIGEVVAKSFLLGFVINLLKSPIGIIFILIVPCLIIIFLEIIKIIGVFSADKKQKEEEAAAQKDKELEELRIRLAKLENSSAQEQTTENNTAPEPAVEASTAEPTEPTAADPEQNDESTPVDEATIAEWQRQIGERAVSGLTVEEWCEKQGISEDTYNYRLEKVKESLAQSQKEGEPK